MYQYRCARTDEIACDVLDASVITARKRLQAFEAAGYLTADSAESPRCGTRWVTTILGDALAHASFGRPVSRVTARRHLVRVVERARAYNADPRRLLAIAEITVFGSYLDPSASARSDLDLAVSAVCRDSNQDRYVHEVLAYARASGRRFGALHEMLYWPERELQLILKNRSPAISITDEDIALFTARAEVVYALGDDQDAIPLPPDAIMGSVAAPRLRVTPSRGPISAMAS
jgi:predicted nucleotidyltransferase